VLDIINHAKFQLDRFRGFGAPGGRKSLSPIDWRYRPYNSVRTNVLHCDTVSRKLLSRNGKIIIVYGNMTLDVFMICCISK